MSDQNTSKEKKKEGAPAKTRSPYVIDSRTTRKDRGKLIDGTMSTGATIVKTLFNRREALEELQLSLEETSSDEKQSAGLGEESSGQEGEEDVQENAVAVNREDNEPEEDLNALRRRKIKVLKERPRVPTLEQNASDAQIALHEVAIRTYKLQKLDVDSELELINEQIAILTEEAERLKKEQTPIWQPKIILPETRNKIFKNLTSVKKFTPELSLTKPFGRWLVQFTAEIGNKCTDEEHLLENMKYWVDAECFEGMIDIYSPEEMNDWSFVVAELENRYGEKRNILERQEEFRKVKQTLDDVRDYTAEKMVTFRMAYPDQEPTTSIEFRREWFDGLWRGFKLELAKHDYLNMEFASAEKVISMEERRLKHVDGTYGQHEGIRDKKKHMMSKMTQKKYGTNVQASKTSQSSTMGPIGKVKTSSSTGVPSGKGNKAANVTQKNCRFFKQGRCTNTNCQFRHATPSQPVSGGTQTSNPINATSTTSQKANVDKPVSKDNYLREKCNRKECQSKPHPKFACRHPKKYCTNCKKEAGHSLQQCPNIECARCKTKGHNERVCGVSREQFF
jgi:hypothetical protein